MLAARTARFLAGVKQMYRLAIFFVLAAPLAACSLNSNSLSSGYADSRPTSSLTRVTPGYGLGSPNRTQKRVEKKGVEVAALGNDNAPKGSFEKAPTGALSDRNYTNTTLNPENARKLINAYRKSKGLQPLQLNATLTKAAKMHSRDLAKWDRISHYGSDGSNPWDRVKRSGYKPRLAAENVGTGQVNFEEVMRGWKASNGHNKNLLLSDASQMGIALVQDPKTEFKSFWTLVIGAPM